MTRFEQKASDETLERRCGGRLEPADGVLCAVSGGADSMALLHWLRRRQEECGLRLCAAHYEHGLRGEESLRDADFVSAWCAGRGIPCVVERGAGAALRLPQAHGRRARL